MKYQANDCTLLLCAHKDVPDFGKGFHDQRHNVAFTCAGWTLNHADTLSASVLNCPALTSVGSG